MQRFGGFLRDTRYTSLPNPLLGPLLAEIDTLGELTCTIRVIALIYQKRGSRPWMTLDELLQDSILRESLLTKERGPDAEILQGIRKAVARGTLLEAYENSRGEERTFILVNDQQGRNTIQRLHLLSDCPDPVEPPTTDESPIHRANIFSLYEENIGTLTPLLTDELKEAAELYPSNWVQDAFKEAVVLQRRNWRYISRILERWALEGKDNGEPGRHPKTTDPKEFLRRYGPPSSR